MSFKIWKALVVYPHFKAYDHLRLIRKTIRIMKSLLLLYLGGFHSCLDWERKTVHSFSHPSFLSILGSPWRFLFLEWQCHSKNKKCNAIFFSRPRIHLACSAVNLKLLWDLNEQTRIFQFFNLSCYLNAIVISILLFLYIPFWEFRGFSSKTTVD